MNVVTTIPELHAQRKELPRLIGLVPTMGYLHEGHISLVHAAKSECASVVVSIFVNPTQFGPTEDLSNYPHDLERDLGLLEKAGVDLVWTPTTDLMYPQDYQTWVSVNELTRKLEAEMRPRHFQGVTTVVSKLFNAVQPDKAYFGQKDAQQATVIQRMVKDLNYNLDIIICPIVREPDGLAMSSRNAYLNLDERKAATVLYRALQAAKQAYDSGVRDADVLRSTIMAVLDEESLATTQYVSCADGSTLNEIEGDLDGLALLSMAVYIGKTRLIDNILIGGN